MPAANTPDSTTLTMPNDTDLLITRALNAPRRLVWEAYTKPEHIKQWLLGPDGWTMPICEMDLRVGGKWKWVWRKEDGAEMAMHGVYKEVVPQQRLVNTESWGEPFPETLNTLVFTDNGNKTLVSTTVHYPTKAARDAAAQTGMKEGLDRSYDRLDDLLKSMTGGRA